MAESKTTNQSDALQGMQIYLTKDDAKNPLSDILAYLNANKNGRRYRLIITHNGIAFEPPIKGEITLELERFGTPGKLTFTTIKSVSQDMSFSEGDRVIFCVADVQKDGSLSDYKGMYVGYVFGKKRDKNHHIEVSCYDQTRYLKNRFSYVFENKTATEIIKSVCSDYGLNMGDMEDTKYQIPVIAEENTEAFDIILIALEETLANTGEMYVFYDDAGTLKLKNAADMMSDVMVRADTAEDFDYETSIDKETYNSVVLYYKPQQTAQPASGEQTTTDTSGVTMDDAYYESAGATDDGGGNPKSGINVVKMINWARSQVGKSSFVAYHLPGNPTSKSAGYCGRFVNSCYWVGGARKGFMSCPNDVKGRWMKMGSGQDGNPPMGAVLFFRGSKMNPKTGSRYGHTGISVGNGYFIHAGCSTIRLQKLDIHATGYLQYYGWGWFNNINLGTKPTSGGGKSVENASKNMGTNAGAAAGSAFYSVLTQNIRR